MVKAVVFLCKETRIHPLRSAISLYIPEYMAAVTLGAVARPTGADDAGRKPSESELDRGALLRGELVDSSDDECESVVSVEDRSGETKRAFSGRGLGWVWRCPGASHGHALSRLLVSPRLSPSYSQ